jgi:hypothetical protein
MLDAEKQTGAEKEIHSLYRLFDLLYQIERRLHSDKRLSGEKLVSEGRAFGD